MLSATPVPSSRAKQRQEQERYQPSGSIGNESCRRFATIEPEKGLVMEPRISIVCLGVKDLERSLQFYRDGLGLPTTRRAEDGIVFFQTNGTCLELFPYEDLAKDVSDDFNVERSKFTGITLAHNVRSKEEVEQILKRAEEAGAKIEKPAQDTEWGGYSGYFSDPDGYLWEVAYGAFDFNDDGSLKIT